MDLMFHAPYLLRGALVLLAAGLPLAIWATKRRREREQVIWLTLLFADLALVAGGGIALTETVPDARAADLSLHVGMTLTVLGMASMCWAAFGFHTARKKAKAVSSPSADKPRWPPDSKA